MPGRTRATEEELNKIRQRIMQGIPAGGRLGPHFEEVAQLDPAIVAVDFLEFRAQVAADGSITQPTRQTTPAGYWAELLGISAWMQDPATDPELAALISFNIEDSNRSGDLFSSELYLAGFVNPQGGMLQPDFGRTLYRFNPTTPVKVEFSIDGDGTNGYATNANAVKHWGVRLHLGLVAAR